MKHFKDSARIALGTIAVLVLLGTMSYIQLEGWDMATSFYFSTMTLTTVGYGDLYPTTHASRVFTSFYALFGVGLTLSSMGMLGASYLHFKIRNPKKKLFNWKR